MIDDQSFAILSMVFEDRLGHATITCGFVVVLGKYPAKQRRLDFLSIERGATWLVLGFLLLWQLTSVYVCCF